MGYICNKRITLALLALSLSACTAMGWQAADETPVATIATPAAWSKSDPSINTAAPAPAVLATWWTQFNDPLLDQLIRESLSAAPDVRIAQARLRQSRASRDLAAANLFPSIGVSALASRVRSSNGNTQTPYAAGFDAAWEPSIFGGLRDAASAADADTAASAASLDSVRASLTAEVALNYINLRTAQRRLGITRDNVASQGETLQITEWRAQAGLVTILDVEQARTNLEQSRSLIPGIEYSRAEAENHLAVLVGRTAGSLHEQLNAVVALPKAPDSVAVGIPADAIRQRPDIRSAEFTLQAETARTAEREADRYPSLNLSGSLGWQAFSIASLGSGSLVSSLAGSLAATLFDGGRIRSRIAVQTAVQEQALIGYETTLLTAFEDVENALTAYAVGRDRVDARRKAAESARNANTLARMQYQAGTVDFQKVLDTDRTRLSAEDGLASADADVLTAVVQLYKALGGGWTHEDDKNERASTKTRQDLIRHDYQD